LGLYDDRSTDKELGVEVMMNDVINNTAISSDRSTVRTGGLSISQAQEDEGWH
jgi:hypothetical protein